MTPGPDLRDAARAAARLRDRHLRHAGLALAHGWRWTARQHLEAATAAELEHDQLLREAVAW